MSKNGIIDLIDLSHKNNTIIVFIANLTNYCSTTVSKYWLYLSTEEKRKANQYYTKELRDKYIISHGILREILSYYIEGSPINIKFMYGKYGKPFLKHTNVQFNMSHSHNIVGYVITSTGQVGIDLEVHNKIININELLKFIFSPKEIKLFSTLENNLIDLLYYGWCIKEALIKTIGLGLVYPIANINVDLLSEAGSVVLKKYQEMEEKKLYYYKLKQDKNYFGAVATEHRPTEITLVEICNTYNIFDNVKIQVLS